MKTKLLLMLMLGLAGSARATGGVVAQPVRNIVPNSVTCSSVTFSSVATELTGNTTAPTSAPVYEITVFPLHASATCYFGDSVNISSFGANIGYPVYPFVGNGLSAQPDQIVFPISPTQAWRGISGNDNGSRTGCSAMVCKKK